MKRSALSWLSGGLAVALLVTFTSAPADAGAVGGPKRFRGTLGGKDKVDIHYVTFKGGEEARIDVEVEGKNADVNLRVIDTVTDRVVAEDRRADDDCFVRFTPRETRKYAIKLINVREKVRPRYTMKTN